MNRQPWSNIPEGNNVARSAEQNRLFFYMGPWVRSLCSLFVASLASAVRSERRFINVVPDTPHEAKMCHLSDIVQICTLCQGNKSSADAKVRPSAECRANHRWSIGCCQCRSVDLSPFNFLQIGSTPSTLRAVLLHPPSSSPCREIARSPTLHVRAPRCADGTYNAPATTTRPPWERDATLCPVVAVVSVAERALQFTTHSGRGRRKSAEEGEEKKHHADLIYLCGPDTTEGGGMVSRPWRRKLSCRCRHIRPRWCESMLSWLFVSSRYRLPAVRSFLFVASLPRCLTHMHSRARAHANVQWSVPIKGTHTGTPLSLFAPWFRTSVPGQTFNWVDQDTILLVWHACMGPLFLQFAWARTVVPGTLILCFVFIPRQGFCLNVPRPTWNLIFLCYFSYWEILTDLTVCPSFWTQTVQK